MANPNPSPETRFKKGSTPNPGGKTSEQKRIEMESGLMAAKLRHKMLTSMMEKGVDSESVLQFLEANSLKLIKDADDRAQGTPKQSVDISNTDGTLGNRTIDETKLTIEQRKALLAARVEQAVDEPDADA